MKRSLKRIAGFGGGYRGISQRISLALHYNKHDMYVSTAVDGSSC